VADPVDKAKDAVGGAAHPVDTAQKMAREAEHGSSDRTPVIALTGVTLAVAALVAIPLTVALVLYLVLK
jgi:hypothetical protein